MTRGKNTNTSPTLLSQKKQDYIFYTCGPTVYKDVHIGNLRPIIISNYYANLFRYIGKNVELLQNITDVDDKIINESKQLKVDPLIMAKKYDDKYRKIILELGIKKVKFYRVTDYMKEIEEYILALKNKGYVYEDKDSYRFSLKDISNEYGKLLSLKLEDIRDFAVWKKAKDGELYFESKSLGKGRPGWHTECAALINKLTNGKGVDLHIAGEDLKFPHNENELIQEQAMNLEEISPLTKSWLHIGMLTIDGEKMSKSLNNTILAKDALLKESPNTIIFWMLSSLFQRPINFSKSEMEKANITISNISTILREANLVLSMNDIKEPKISERSEKLCKWIEDTLMKPSHRNEMRVEVQSLYSTLLKSLNQFRNTGKLDGAFVKDYHCLRDLFLLATNGLNKGKIEPSKDLYRLYLKWMRLREKKMFGEADDVRKKLMEKKILL